MLIADRGSEWREIVRQPPAAMRSDWTAVHSLSAGASRISLTFCERFRNKILPDGTLDDRASPELNSRPPRDRLQAPDSGIASRLLRKLAEGGAVQDELITIRGERFVIPVKVEQKRRVQGVVHGASSSGQTVFVEPMETIEQNNELVRLLDEEQAEIHRSPAGDDPANRTKCPGDSWSPADVLAELELQFAKSHFAEDDNCVAVMASSLEEVKPSLDKHSHGDGGIDSSMPSARLLLHRARHPLLERNLKLKDAKIVPITRGTRRGTIASW